MDPYRSLMNGARPHFEASHLQDLALAQLTVLVLALVALVFLGA